MELTIFENRELVTLDLIDEIVCVLSICLWYYSLYYFFKWEMYYYNTSKPCLILEWDYNVSMVHFILTYMYVSIDDIIKKQYIFQYLLYMVLQKLR